MRKTHLCLASTQVSLSLSLACREYEICEILVVDFLMLWRGVVLEPFLDGVFIPRLFVLFCVFIV